MANEKAKREMINKKKRAISKAVAKLPKLSKPKKKLSNAEFWETLAENGGLISRTARAIEAKFGISITYQAVRHRAMLQPEMLAYVKEYNVERAVGVIQGLMLTSRREDVKLKAAETYLKAVGGIAPLTIHATAGNQDEADGSAQAVSLTIKIQQ